MDSGAAGDAPSPDSYDAVAAAEKVISSLAASAARLSAVSRAIPAGRDFHFYNNFPDFKSPVKQISSRSESLLQSLANSSPDLFGSHHRHLPPPPLAGEFDPEDAHNWIVSLNDDLIEVLDASMDEFKSLREKAESEAAQGENFVADMESGGFMMVRGKKKRGIDRNHEKTDGPSGQSSSTVKVAERDKKTEGRSKIPFHIPSIPRPQDKFNIIVNNTNMPFEHVWLERSIDNTRFVHPLEKLAVTDFIDRSLGEGEPEKPPPLESTPFTLVEDVKELKELAAKLRAVNEFAVDLEHNQYRSFQGLTCLMQISTRSEDFIIDTLKLRIHVGPHLREVFRDPSKRKVMHGADRDVLWLQRDFGIYICNLFDTGQASRVLQLERNSLEYLLNHFCAFNANKEYQNADWRLRPLPDEMIKYAREDTHYLLYIYDLMKMRLIEASSDENDLQLEVYKRSCETCLQLYEKELLTDTSYLYIYGLHEADFDAKQLAVAAGLCEWRDAIARAEDESTGYILPNRSLLEIARQTPLTAHKLRGLVKSKHPFVERHLNDVVSIVRSSIKNSSTFEGIADQLKRARIEAILQANVQNKDAGNSEMTSSTEESLMSGKVQGDAPAGAVNASDTNMEEVAEPTDAMVVEASRVSNSIMQSSPKSKLTVPIECGSAGAHVGEKQENGCIDNSTTRKASVVTVQMVKKPVGAFGALLGSTSGRKSNFDMAKNKVKIEQIKSSVTLPFYSFTGGEKRVDRNHELDNMHQPENSEQDPIFQDQTSKPEEAISLEIDTKKSQAQRRCEVNDEHRNWLDPVSQNSLEGSPDQSDAAEEVMSISDLSSSFQQCYQSITDIRSTSQDLVGNLQFKPFDYAAARREMKVGRVHQDDGNQGDAAVIANSPDFGDLRKGLGLNRPNTTVERVKEQTQPRRRQAFPASGNRSMTYR